MQDAHGMMTSIFLLDAAGTVLMAESLHSAYAKEKLIGKPAWVFLHPPHDAVIQAAIMRAMSTNREQTVEITDSRVGDWLVKYIPAKAGKVRLIAISRQIPAEVSRLTMREREVCAAVADCTTGKQAAVKLRIKRTTLDNHKRNIAQKLSMPTAQVAKWAAQNREWLNSCK